MHNNALYYKRMRKGLQAVPIIKQLRTSLRDNGGGFICVTQQTPWKCIAQPIEWVVIDALPTWLKCRLIIILTLFLFATQPFWA